MGRWEVALTKKVNKQLNVDVSKIVEIKFCVLRLNEFNGPFVIHIFWLWL